MRLVSGDDQSDRGRIDAQGQKPGAVEMAALQDRRSFLDDQGPNGRGPCRPLSQPRQQEGCKGARCAAEVAGDLMGAAPQTTVRKGLVQV